LFYEAFDIAFRHRRAGCKTSFVILIGLIGRNL
jgi:hypothetical protein